MFWNSLKAGLLVASLIFSIVILSGCDPKHIPADQGVPDDKGVEADSFSAPGLLRKISFHIKGLNPSEQEYQSVLSAAEGSEKAVIANWARDFVQSQEHIDKMTYRLQEMFHLTPNDSSRKDSFANIISEVIQRNLSWDELFTAKKFRIPSSESRFFEKAAPKILSQSEKEMLIEFEPADSKIAGLITTPRFFGRYVNTATNKNRRRAAGVFNIMLCQDFRTVLDSSAEKEEEILDLVFPKAGSYSSHIQILDEDKHSSDPACVKCHQKLDPVGKTFRAIATGLAPFATPGALVIENESGVLETTEVDGLGDLIKAVTKTDQYVHCQTAKMWQWFIGEDIPITPQRKKELFTEFNRLGRRVNDFVLYLVSRPEFGGIESSNNKDIRDIVRGSLKSCDSCHDSKLPKFGDWPIGGSEESHKSWMGKLDRVLGLSGQKQSMPPVNSPWQPSAVEKSRIKNWIDQGGPL